MPIKGSSSVPRSNLGMEQLKKNPTASVSTDEKVDTCVDIRLTRQREDGGRADREGSYTGTFQASALGHSWYDSHPETA